jgi:hypothetical protein
VTRPEDCCRGCECLAILLVTIENHYGITEMGIQDLDEKLTVTASGSTGSRHDVHFGFQRKGLYQHLPHDKVGVEFYDVSGGLLSSLDLGPY